MEDERCNISDPGVILVGRIAFSMNLASFLFTQVSSQVLLRYVDRWKAGGKFRIDIEYDRRILDAC